MCKTLGYIIPKNFTGSVLSVVCESPSGIEFVAYTNMSVAQYLEANSDQGAYVVSVGEFDKLNSSYLESLIESPKEIDEERFNWLLECMPPCRWKTIRGVEMFHMCERYTANIVTWVAASDGVFFEFLDTENKDGLSIANKVEEALALRAKHLKQGYQNEYNSTHGIITIDHRQYSHI